MPDRAIPSEATLMQRYGVARETVRKAVRVLTRADMRDFARIVTRAIERMF